MWLVRAQDATGCGGVSAYYDLKQRQWAAAYPETTGYIIPTFLEYARFSGRDEYHQRALAMANWECDIQLANGGVQAGLADATQGPATIFNTGQVILGWLAAWEDSHEPRFRESLTRAADWLLSVQDDDGAWRRFGSPFSAHSLNSYNTRVAFALVKAGKVLKELRYVAAGTANVNWALTQMRSNGWLENNDLEDNTRPLTHTISYAIRGILEVGLLVDSPQYLAASERAALAVANAQRVDGALPGRLDENWMPAARWTCLTGNSQMAIIWFKLWKKNGEANLRECAERINQFNSSIPNTMTKDSCVNGAVPGSYPVSGAYMKNRYPNWAAKFFMDALMSQLKG